ncbi:MAG TPA: TolC family protein [Candidatus Kapabacteria bacterium]|nr:TolC family protein [Candidatus Kapabacteria bacterium]
MPEVLQSYIEIALKQNPEMSASRAKWDQADARVDQANSNLWPKLDFTSRYTTFDGGRIIAIPNGPSLPTAQFGITKWDNKLEAAWPIFNYAVWQGTKATRAYLDAATHEVEAKELAIAYQVSEGYFSYARATELVAIRKSAVELAKQNLATAKALFDAQKAAKNDVLRAEVAVAASQGEVLAAQNQQMLARTNFNNLLKRDYDADIVLLNTDALSAYRGESPRLASNNGGQSLNTTTFAADYSSAVTTRPEIMQIDNAKVALEGIKNVNAADYFPNVALFGSYGWQEDQLKFSNDVDLLIGGVQLRWNLFSGFNTNAKVAETTAQIHELQYQKESLMNGIRIELHNARLDRDNARERYAIAIKQLEAAEENRRITKALYDAGQAPLITMIDAESTLANAKANLTVTTYDELLAEAKYRKAIGVR